MTERWYCLDCHHLGPLSLHGRCERCDSDAVVPHDMVRVEAHFDLRHGTWWGNFYATTILQHYLSLAQSTTEIAGKSMHPIALQLCKDAHVEGRPS